MVRFTRLPVDDSVAEEIQLAEVYTLDAAIEAIDATAAELGSGELVVARVPHELDKQRSLLAAAGADDDPVVQHHGQYTSLSLALIARRREALLELRDEQRIDDIVLRRVQAQLDNEEVRLLRADPRRLSKVSRLPRRTRRVSRSFAWRSRRRRPPRSRHRVLRR